MRCVYVCVCVSFPLFCFKTKGILWLASITKMFFLKYSQKKKKRKRKLAQEKLKIKDKEAR